MGSGSQLGSNWDVRRPCGAKSHRRSAWGWILLAGLVIATACNVGDVIAVERKTRCVADETQKLEAKPLSAPQDDFHQILNDVHPPSDHYHPISYVFLSHVDDFYFLVEQKTVPLQEVRTKQSG